MKYFQVTYSLEKVNFSNQQPRRSSQPNLKLLCHLKSIIAKYWLEEEAFQSGNNLVSYSPLVFMKQIWIAIQWLNLFSRWCHHVILSVTLFLIIKRIFGFAKIRTHNLQSDNQTLYYWATLTDDIWFTILLYL